MVVIRLVSCHGCGDTIRTIENHGIYIVHGRRYCGSCYNERWAGP